MKKIWPQDQIPRSSHIFRALANTSAFINFPHFLGDLGSPPFSKLITANNFSRHPDCQDQIPRYILVYILYHISCEANFDKKPSEQHAFKAFTRG